MSDVVVIGDGPGGLSAALFLAKNDLEVVVFGKDETAMHWAMLYNYLGIPEISGSDFQDVGRQQVHDHGGKLVDDVVTSVTRGDDGFTVHTAGGRKEVVDHVVVSEGKNPEVIDDLDVNRDEKGTVLVDRWGRTNVPDVYAVGRMVRPGRSQAIISAGDGAAAAIDILAKRAGKVKWADWDTPPAEE